MGAGNQGLPKPGVAKAQKSKNAAAGSDPSPIDSSAAPKAFLAVITSPKGASAPAPRGGLAMRRKVWPGLNVAIAERKDMSNGEVSVSSTKTIKVVKRFADHYTLGKEVMPSTNAGMDVLFAKRVSDKKEVVIKTRLKCRSFRGGKTDEVEWRKSTEMLMNLHNSENIAQIYEVLEDDKYYYVVMEKVEGTDLFEKLHAERSLDPGEAKAILRQLLLAVKDLHAKGCIHKDLKLENVMIDGSSSPRSSPKGNNKKGSWLPGQAFDPEDSLSPTVVKLIDFDTIENYSSKNKATSVVGTDQYIAQEAYAGHYSPASDIFSVGVMAYKLISGKFPFKQEMFDDKPGENWVGSPKMKVIQERLKDFNVEFTIAPWPHEASARDLVRGMLQNNEKERPTATEALEHAFFEVTGKTPKLPKITDGPWASFMKK